MEVTMKIFLIRHGEDDERYKGGWNRLPLISRGKLFRKKAKRF